MRLKLLIPFAFVLTLLGFSGVSSAQQVRGITEIRRDSTPSTMLYFRFDKAVVDSGYMNNAASLKELDGILTNKVIISGLDSIVIVSSSSIDGVVEYNKKLSQQRAVAVKGYLIWKYPNIEQSTIHTHSIGENWDGLKELVEKDTGTPYREQILEILRQDVNAGTKEWRLKQIDGGKAYEYITNNMLRYLRSGAATVVFYHKQEVTQEVTESKPIEEEPVKIEQVKEQTQPIVEQVVVIAEEITVKRPYYLAVKTNLLYDAFGVANIGAEFAVGRHFSLDIPFIYSPYTIKRDYKFRLLAFQPEFRYWLSEPLSGHFFGLHGTVGWFNVAKDTENRYQDSRPVYGAGISYGYALPLSKHWGAEFTIAGGYANIEYDTYYNISNGAKFDSNSKHYWGITRLGISLVYKFNLKK